MSTVELPKISLPSEGERIVDAGGRVGAGLTRTLLNLSRAIRLLQSGNNSTDRSAAQAETDAQTAITAAAAAQATADTAEADAQTALTELSNLTGGSTAQVLTKSSNSDFDFEWDTPSAGSTPGGSSGDVQYNDSGAFGGLTDTQLTARIQTFTPLLSGAAPSSGGGTTNFLRADGSWAVPPGTASGTVTSVGLALPGEFSVSGSPVTTAGTLTGAWASQTANKIFASPNGSAGTPSFRAMVGADLPAPSGTTLGGVKSASAPAHQFQTGIDTAGAPTFAQPAATDVSGLAASATTDTTNAANISSGTLPAARLPNPSATTLGGIQSIAASAHKWIASISTSGVPNQTQPAFSDLSGSAAANQVPVGTAYQSAALTATAPNSALARKMGGLAGSFTPTKSGTILLMLTATVINASGTANVGANWQLAYGTGSAPAANATLTGSAAGPVVEYRNPTAVTAADVRVPIALAAVVTGLTVGTAYWLDVSQQAITTVSQANLTAPEFSVIEL